MSHLDKILSDPKAQDLMWVMRVIESSRLDLPRIGDSLSLRHDSLRADQPPELAFATSSIARIDQTNKGLRLAVNAFGMWGPNGVLPLNWTESVRDRLHHAKDPTLCRFIGIFHHRMICLFYKAWARTQKAVDFDRPLEQRFLDHLSALAGVSVQRGTKAKTDLPDFTKVYYSGLLGHHARDPLSLARILSDFFGVAFRVEEFVPRWIPIGQSDRSSLGHLGCAIGESAVLGENFWDAKTKFRLIAGPVDREQLERLALNAQARAFLHRWMGQWVGFELEWELRIEVLPAEAPAAQLGSSRLGRTGWSLSGRPQAPLEAVTLTQAAIANS